MSLRTASTGETLKRLRQCITRQPPYASGTLPVESDHVFIYYGKDDNAQRLDCAGAGQDKLEALSQSCDRASFGVDNKTVEDENYRKAGKLDSNYFSTPFVPERSKLVEVIRSNLLEGSDALRPLELELYKLNVYDEGSFFKPHKDTPRSGNMFASLVVVFPTSHEGGALVLRHGHEERTFDSAKALKDAEESSVAYITFFSDVEHEVLPVTKGYRITLTYNIYCADVDKPNAPAALSVDPRAASSHEDICQSALRDLLDSPDFLPEGGTLGFGLRHVYPILTSPEDPYSASLERVRKLLKGSDALVFHACTKLGVHPALYYGYGAQPSSEPSKYERLDHGHKFPNPSSESGQLFMLDHVPDLDCDLMEQEEFEKRIGGTMVYNPDGDNSDDEPDEVNWVSMEMRQAWDGYTRTFVSSCRSANPVTVERGGHSPSPTFAWPSS
ncbi:hypothetical protein FA95DRAFT_1608779 [Auriscalpium vulgare]|uniref:Uncharacterized protein n=1 Tax=Auriscalpium vulgare TaxID=40419 RepID=A0ACB8RKJ3_9AGAM|nr:hypothetical protein FA95DRAFT_1608779 [Auriscalpium vulgare]